MIIINSSNFDSGLASVRIKKDEDEEDDEIPTTLGLLHNDDNSIKEEIMTIHELDPNYTELYKNQIKKNIIIIYHYTTI